MIKIKKHVPKFIIIALFLLFIYFACLVLRPFFLAVLTAAVVAYIFYPIYKKLVKLTKRESLSSLITLFIIFLIMLLPVTFIVSTLSKEAVTGYAIISNIIDGDFFEEKCKSNNIICKVFSSGKSIVSNEQFKAHLGGTFKSIVTFVVEKSSAFLFSIPQRIFEIFLTFFIMFFFLKDGKRIIDWLWALVHITNKDKKMINSRVGDIVFAVVYGSIIVALLQGIIAGVGYWIFGIKAPIFWGFMTALTALLPVIGTAIIWLPASLILIINGLMMYDTSGILKGIGLFIYGILIVSTIDNFMKPKVIGDKAKIHPIIVILGVFGGLIAFGLVGAIIGPLVLALLITFIDMYRQYIIK